MHAHACAIVCACTYKLVFPCRRTHYSLWTTFGSQSLPSISFEKGSLVCLSIHYASWPMSFWGSPVSTSHSAKGARILKVCAITSGFMWIIEIQIQILMPVQQVYYTPNHLPLWYLDIYLILKEQFLVFQYKNWHRAIKILFLLLLLDSLLLCTLGKFGTCYTYSLQ